MNHLYEPFVCRADADLEQASLSGLYHSAILNPALSGDFHIAIYPEFPSIVRGAFVKRNWCNASKKKSVR